VFNVTLDLTYSLCSEIWIAPFDDIRGGFANVSIVGNITLKNIQTTNLTTTAPQIYLSKFVGNMMWSPASGNRTLNGSTLNNVSSSLNYIVNGTLITVDNQTVLYNSTTLRIRYLNEFDSIYMDPTWVLNLSQPVGGNWTYMANTSQIIKPYT